ncbi:MAG: mechanosensitive ion channel [Acidobacteriota bacterium]|nr:mechanosensitive ion channel [Acidobacteriota bacterium]MDH3530059.1 mechanosensitive ion channel [Acidobacteriota bacterium]
MLLQNSNTAPNIAGSLDKDVAKTSEIINNSLDKLLTSLAEQIPYIIGGLVVIALFWLLANILKRIFLYMSGRTGLDRRLRMLISRLLVITIVVIGIFTSLTIMIPNFGFSNLIAGLGFSSFIVGFATKDILNNFLSGILVLWQQPFKLGDYVSVDDFDGEVEEIGLRATQLKMLDGEKIIIPNGQMYSSALIIKPAGALQRVKIEIVTDYSSKVRTSKELILKALNSVGGIGAEPPPKVSLNLLSADGIKLTAYFWVDTEKDSVMEVFDSASQAINSTLRDGGVKLFPAQRVIINEMEKQGSTYTDDSL